jgi:hypothetical protein
MFLSVIVRYIPAQHFNGSIFTDIRYSRVWLSGPVPSVRFDIRSEQIVSPTTSYLQ